MTLEPVIRQPSRTRRALFAVLTTVVALMFATNMQLLLAPWVEVNITGVADPDSHRWHHALEGAGVTLVLAAIVGVLLRPSTRSVLAQFVGVAAVLAALVNAPFVGPMYLIIVAVLLLVPATYPWPAALRQLRSADGVSRPLLMIGSVAAAALSPLAVLELHWQLTGYLGEQATSAAWSTDVEFLVILVAAGLLAATRLPGWRVLSVGCAAVYTYLGVVAIALPAQPGSWGLAGGVAALTVAAGFIAATRAHGPLLTPRLTSVRWGQDSAGITSRSNSSMPERS